VCDDAGAEITTELTMEKTAVHCIPERMQYEVRQSVPYTEYVLNDDNCDELVSVFKVVERCIIPNEIYDLLQSQRAFLPGSILPEYQQKCYEILGENQQEQQQREAASAISDMEHMYAVIDSMECNSENQELQQQQHQFVAQQRQQSEYNIDSHEQNNADDINTHQHTVDKSNTQQQQQQQHQQDQQSNIDIDFDIDIRVQQLRMQEDQQHQETEQQQQQEREQHRSLNRLQQEVQHLLQQDACSDAESDSGKCLEESDFGKCLEESVSCAVNVSGTKDWLDQHFVQCYAYKRSDAFSAQSFGISVMLSLEKDITNKERCVLRRLRMNRKRLMKKYSLFCKMYNIQDSDSVEQVASKFDFQIKALYHDGRVIPITQLCIQRDIPLIHLARAPNMCFFPISANRYHRLLRRSTSPITN